jgi:hypothetical protein
MLSLSRKHPGAALFEALSLFYVYFPLLLFVMGWLRYALAVPLAIVLLGGITLGYVRQLRGTDAGHALPPWQPVLTGPRIAFLLAAAFIAAVAAGIGGIIHQFDDYYKHNMVYLALMRAPWPFGFDVTDVEGQHRLFVPPYYFGYYLPAGFVGKFLGWQIGYAFSLFWGWLGIVLALGWFLRLCRSASAWLVLMFLLFGGLDLIGLLLLPSENLAPLAASFPGSGILGLVWFMMLKGQVEFLWPSAALLGDPAAFGGHVVWYLGQMNRLFYGPHHTIAPWIVVLMIFYDATRRNTCERAGLLWITLLNSSMFAAMGAACVVALAALQTRMRRAISLMNLSAVPLLVIFYLFYATADGEIASSFLLVAHDLRATWPFLLSITMSAFGVYAILAPRATNKEVSPGPLWWWGTIALLIGFQCFSIGLINELSSHALVGPTAIFLVCLATRLRLDPDGTHPQPWRRRLLIAALVLGTGSSLGILYHAAALGIEPGTPPEKQIRQPSETVPRFWILQLTGNTDAFFWKHLAQPLTILPEKEIPVVRAWDRGTADMKEHWEGSALDEGGTPVDESEPFLRYVGPPFEASDVGGIAVWMEPQGFDALESFDQLGMHTYWSISTVPEDTVGRMQWMMHTRPSPRRVGDGLVWEDQISQYTYWKDEITEMRFLMDLYAAVHVRLEVTRIEFLER